MQLIDHSHKFIKQFIVFVGVGAVNTCVSLSIILILSQWVGLHYMLSNFLGYLAGLGIGFTLHSQVTFREKRKNSDKTLLEFLRSFAFIFSVAYMCQLLLLYILVDVIRINDALAQVVAVGMYTMINFLGNRFWTFK